MLDHLADHLANAVVEVLYEGFFLLVLRSEVFLQYYQVVAEEKFRKQKGVQGRFIIRKDFLADSGLLIANTKFKTIFKFLLNKEPMLKFLDQLNKPCLAFKFIILYRLVFI